MKETITKSYRQLAIEKDAIITRQQREIARLKKDKERLDMVISRYEFKHGKLVGKAAIDAATRQHRKDGKG